MAGLRRYATAAVGSIATVLLVLGLATCKQTLDMRNTIQASVDAANAPKVLLTLKDGATTILPGQTASWPNTIFGVAIDKTLTLTNTGAQSVSLTGTPVGITGGSGQMAYSIFSQPPQLTLSPGSSTSFVVRFNPATADSDFPCNFVVNSNDPANPGYAFHGIGHSTQWHGTLKVASTTVSAMILSPKIAFDDNSVYLSYAPPSAEALPTKITRSTNGGKSWVIFSDGPSPASAYPHILGSRTGTTASVGPGPHIFYFASGAVHYRKWITAETVPTWSTSDLTSNTSTSGGGAVINADMCLAGGYVYLAWYDSATTSLKYNFSFDPWWNTSIPGGQEMTSFSSPGLQSLTDGSTQVGGDSPSIQRDSSGNMFILYADNTNHLLRLVADTTPTTQSAFTNKTYHTVATGQYEVANCILALTGSGSSTVLHAVWSQNAPMEYLYYSHTTSSNLDGWSTPAALHVNNRYGNNLRFSAGSDGRLYVLCEDDSHSLGIALSTSPDAGSTWINQSLDSNACFTTSHVYSALGLTIVGSTIYVAYGTAPPHTDGYALYLMKSIDGGVTW